MVTLITQVAAGLGIATLRILLKQARASATATADVSSRSAEIAASPHEPPHSRRAFMRWTTGAGAVALTGVGVGRAVEGTGGVQARGQLLRAMPEIVVR